MEIRGKDYGKNIKKYKKKGLLFKKWGEYATKTAKKCNNSAGCAEKK